MKILIWFALGIAILAVIFAIQNTAPVTISFFAWSVQGSLALVLLVTLAAGILISFLVSLPGAIGGRWNTSGLNKKLAQAENERDMYLQKAEEAEKEVAALKGKLADLPAMDQPDQLDEPSQTG